MKTGSLIVANANPVAASKLASSLNSHFSSVSIRRSVPELANDIRQATANLRALALVLDLETVSLNEVEQLCRELNDMVVVCTHRVADEEMWTAAMNAGATDCCDEGDIAGILRAVDNQLARGTAA